LSLALKALSRINFAIKTFAFKVMQLPLKRRMNIQRSIDSHYAAEMSIFMAIEPQKLEFSFSFFFHLRILVLILDKTEFLFHLL
jgi:hypothetical protein